VQLLLLDNGADVNLRSHDKWPALHWACNFGNEAVVQLLVEIGADVNPSAYGWTAMLLAAKHSKMSIVYFLIQKGADVNAEDYHGRAALHSPVKYGSESVVELLVKKGADVNAVDRWGRTALIWAVENTQKALVERNAARDWADVEVKAQSTFTALNITTFMGWELVVQQLLEKGVDAEAEVQCYVAGESREYKDDAAEMADNTASDLLRPCLALG